MRDRLIPIDRRMRRRIALKITPRDVNEMFRAALDRFNNPNNGQNDHIETENGVIELTQENLDEAVRRLHG